MIPDGKAGQRRYGTWAGKPDGHPEDLARCIESVYVHGRYVPAQCSRNRGHGPDGEFCKQHAKTHFPFTSPEHPSEL
jgi:hypothetical protein